MFGGPLAARRRVTNIFRRTIDSQYLLPGLARCAWCHGGLFVQKRTRTGRPASHFYGCTSFHQRGASVCGNSMRLPMANVDETVLHKIRDIVTPDIVDDVLASARAELGLDHRAATRERLTRELADAEARIGRLTAAIAAGAGDVPELVAELQEAHRRRQALRQDVIALEDESGVRVPDWRVLEAEARRWLADWRGLLARHPIDARPALRELLEGPIRFTQTTSGARFEGAIVIGGILAGNVAIEGSNERWRPRAEIRTATRGFLQRFRCFVSRIGTRFRVA